MFVFFSYPGKLPWSHFLVMHTGHVTEACFEIICFSVQPYHLFHFLKFGDIQCYVMHVLYYFQDSVRDWNYGSSLLVLFLNTLHCCHLGPYLITSPYTGASQDSASGRATCYGLNSWGVGVQIPVGQDFSFLHVVQPGSGAHTAFYPMGTGGKGTEAWSWPLISN
jgi:hypothetical protein